LNATKAAVEEGIVPGMSLTQRTHSILWV
jgi:hypothetical protein